MQCRTLARCATPPAQPVERQVERAAAENAQERLILRRDTHIDDLANKLREDRVRRVVAPILAGTSESAWSSEDVAYLHDLGWWPSTPTPWAGDAWTC